MIVGTAGHIDHGKTSLVRAITGVDTDRLKEEKARGISIDLGFAYMPAGDGTVMGFIDVPGHEKFVHTMLAGAGGIDLALLVVAADDGVMPQTREHLAIIDLLGVRHGLIALTKTDLVDEERILAVTVEIEALVAGTVLEGAAILPVSTHTGAGIAAVRAALEEARASIAQRACEGRFRLAVDRSFTLQGTGTVVTGTVLSGTVDVGDRLMLSPSGRSVRVRSIRAQDRPAERGQAGDRCGINLAGEGLAKDDISRGDVLLDESLHAPADHIDARLNVLSGEPKPIGQWFPVRLHHAAREVGARIVLLGDPIAPGGSALVQLVLDAPISAAVGDRYVIRDTSAQRTIGGGVFLDLRGPARKRRTPERLAQLTAMAETDPAEAVKRLLDIPPFFLDLSTFARDRALGEQAVPMLVTALNLKTFAVGPGNALLALSGARWAAFSSGLLATLDTFHTENPDLPGLGIEKLRLQSEPRLPAPAFKAALQALAQTREIALDGAWVRRSGFSVRLTSQDEGAWSRIAPMLGDTERFRPPRTRDIANAIGMSEADVRRLLKLLGRLARVDEVAHDHFFLRGTVGEMVVILERLSAEHGEFTAAQFRDQVDNGRKVAIQILEFFDRHGVTLRRGDMRRLNPHRLDLFRSTADDVPADKRPADALDPAEITVPEASMASAQDGGEASLVGRPDFKSGRGREPVLGGFDSHSLPPSSPKAPKDERQ
ncbi:selenocysteine-specific translation factor [Azorhizobium oxalatiphilum]|uniref:Selenocysteine-specific elongation factor n=1 Tax=Azorhizobium oxalatiphilum TaxID=980631 RepID=A0A917CII1_9HYPH|nr:selenocysteine-specific translation factor [Azorhizobium oxalatiphilum]